MQNYDLIIIGGGPGGITAGIYAKRAGLNVAIIEKSLPGGTLNNTFEVSNYTGFDSVSGSFLAEKMFSHLNSFEIPFVTDEVKEVSLDGDQKIVKCYHETYTCKAVILALGAQVRRLNATNEKKFLGKGVSYCATCDGNFFKGKDVAIVGAGNTAIEDGIYLSNIVRKLYIIHRRDRFTGESYLVERLKKCKNIELVFDSEICDLKGENALEQIVVRNIASGERRTLDACGLFICIGRGPDTSILNFEVEKDQMGYIVTDQFMKTSVDGVYAVGDIRNTPLRQIVTACADGAIAATKCFEYIRKKS